MCQVFLLDKTETIRFLSTLCLDLLIICTFWQNAKPNTCSTQYGAVWQD